MTSMPHDPRFLTGYKTDGGNVVTPIARISFPYLSRPQMPGPDNDLKEPKFSVVLLFPANADLALLKQAANEAVVKKFGTDPKAYPANLKNPFRDQGEKKFEGYSPGCKMFTATSKQKPQIVDALGNYITDETLLYPGAWVWCSVNAFGYDNKSKGVAFGLNNVQKIRDDEPLGGRARAEAEFKPVAGAATSDAGAAAGSSAANIFG